MRPAAVPIKNEAAGAPNAVCGSSGSQISLNQFDAFFDDANTY